MRGLRGVTSFDKIRISAAERRLIPRSRLRHRRNRYGWFDRDLIIRLLAPVATNIINADPRCILDPSNPFSLPFPPHPLSPIPFFFSGLSSWLVNSRRDITEEIRQNDYLFLLPFSTLFLLFFAVPFCVPFALKRGIKWPCISQEVGVSPWCSFQKVRRTRGKEGGTEGR